MKYSIVNFFDFSDDDAHSKKMKYLYRYLLLEMK